MHSAPRDLSAQEKERNVEKVFRLIFSFNYESEIKSETFGEIGLALRRDWKVLRLADVK